MRRPDTIKVEAVGRGVFDQFTSAEVTNDILQASRAGFELGDDGSWRRLNEYVAPGQLYQVWVNERPRMKGRVVMNDVPCDSSGSVVRFEVRTKLADAEFASADPRVATKNVTLRDFLVKIFARIAEPSDFVVETAAMRDLMTGRLGSAKAPEDIDAIKEEDAKANPPETVRELATRHLARFGLIMWDMPDGRIGIGKPNDEQDPTYFFRMMIGKDGRANNLLSANRIKDWSQLPSSISVFGVGGKSNFTKAKIAGRITQRDVVDAGFFRPVLLQADGLKSSAMAERAARREQAIRNRSKEAWELTADGFSYWDGSTSIPFANDTVCDITSGVAGGPAGAYYVHKTTLRQSAEDGNTSRLSVMQRGLWIS
jgi:prophage tail gpP-like protein